MCQNFKVFALEEKQKKKQQNVYNNNKELLELKALLRKKEFD